MGLAGLCGIDTAGFVGVVDQHVVVSNVGKG